MSIVTYTHPDDPSGTRGRFRQLKADPLPVWAVDVRDEDPIESAVDVRDEDPIESLRAELAAAYAELRKQWPACTAVFDREVWDRAWKAE